MVGKLSFAAIKAKTVTRKVQVATPTNCERVEFFLQADYPIQALPSAYPSKNLDSDNI